MEKVLILLAASLLGGLLYRLGGIGKPFNTKFRDFGIPTIICALLYAMFHVEHWITLFFTFGIVFAAQTSYFKKKGTDAKWFNWLFVGIAFSLSLILIPIHTGDWMGFLYRTLAVIALTTLWSQFISKDWLEEGGRGFIQVVTLPLLFI